VSEWRVTWSIDLDADTPREAAAAAEGFMRALGSRVFHVTEHKARALTHLVDLDEDNPDRFFKEDA
jgi:hypothetical protein